MKIIQRLYDLEINISISSFWDGGFEVKLGDEMNGYKAEDIVRGWDNVEAWFEAKANEHFSDRFKTKV